MDRLSAYSAASWPLLRLTSAINGQFRGLGYSRVDIISQGGYSRVHITTMLPGDALQPNAVE